MRILQKTLIIQTAFIGDVILSTSLVEKLKMQYPDMQIDFLVRKGNESVLSGNPKLNKILIWEKRLNKYSNLFKIINEIRNNNYDLVINLQRFFSTGLITALSKSKLKVGFKKNPLSLFFTLRISHNIGTGEHEIDRNQNLITELTDKKPEKPVLYPSSKDKDTIKTYTNSPYITISPSSVWFTKQFPGSKWIDFINSTNNYNIYLLGSNDDFNYCQDICDKAEINDCFNLAGKLSLTQSAELMKHAKMNYVNDSAPLHLASSVNASVTAIFCSTIPAFGFGPLSDDSHIVESTKKLECRPCGLHGKKKCKTKDFECGYSIEINKLSDFLNN